MDRLLTIFRIPELRRKIFLTVLLLAIYRIGFYIPLPIIDQSALAEWQESISQEAFGKVLGLAATLSGSQVGMSTIFGLGIMPYISASIIFQLLSSVIPQLEAISKEGESGRKKINEYTRYATVLICAIQSFFWVNYLMGMGDQGFVLDQSRSIGPHLASVLIMTTGTVFLMWIGEQIDEYGIGNGISLLIMAGILSRADDALFVLLNGATLKLTGSADKPYSLVVLLLLGILFIAVIVGVIAITESQRRIPTQSAKHIRGRRAYGGTKQYLPFKVNQAGVMPIIFASSLLMVPYMLFSGIVSQLGGWLDDDAEPWQQAVASFLENAADAFQSQGYVYIVSFVLLIYFFCFFWTAITFNPQDIANNLKDYGSFIQGYRPGRSTAVYLEKVMQRITYVGAAFLSLVAVCPTLVQIGLEEVGNTVIDPVITSFLGGTGLLIVVSVCLDLVQKIDSHLIMRNQPGLLNRH